MSPYAELIREDVARLGLVGRYDPADVEAWMRVESPTLDALPAAVFASEVAIACQCIDSATREQTDDLRRSFGL